jgi:hypothetical protein
VHGQADDSSVLHEPRKANADIPPIMKLAREDVEAGAVDHNRVLIPRYLVLSPRFRRSEEEQTVGAYDVL